MKKNNDSKKNSLTASFLIEDLILNIRGQNVILDADLARLYGVKTMVLNQAVKRNIGRFPNDFMFKLIKEEKEELITNCDRFENLKHSSAFPNAFTEHGALMLSAVLKSDTAINISIEVVRAFTKMRRILAQNQELAKQVSTMQQKLSEHDENFKAIFEIINKLILPNTNSKKKVGFI